MSHNFTALYNEYPNIIAHMTSTFYAHKFILKLAEQNQGLYIQALHAYISTERDGEPAPFMIVHGGLATRLSQHPTLIRQIAGGPSIDIFGNANGCSRWEKMPTQQPNPPLPPSAAAAKDLPAASQPCACPSDEPQSGHEA
jgi:hypothetical protein